MMIYFYNKKLDIFFQAEDGIRDGHVTGVQTCALPISKKRLPRLLKKDCGPTASSRRSALTGKVHTRTRVMVNTICSSSMCVYPKWKATRCCAGCLPVMGNVPADSLMTACSFSDNSRTY